MAVGQWGYVVPWAMWLDADGNAYLNEAYTYSDCPGGTVQLKITRTYNGYIAHVAEMKSDYKWQKSRMHGFNSDDRDCFGVVVAFDEPAKAMPPTKKSIFSFFWN